MTAAAKMHQKNAPTLEDRLAARQRPTGEPLMHQSWDRLIFLNWKVSPALIRSLIPDGLAIDTFDGHAWITISPFTIYDVRPAFLPKLPVDLGFHELNVRTYVHLDGVPGVWFFSLDANSFSAVHGARLFYYLPYFAARIDFNPRRAALDFALHRAGSDARFRAGWSIGHRLAPAEPGSLEFFLCERYVLYAERDGSLYKCRIHHEPWPLHQAEKLTGIDSTMAEASHLPRLTGNPVARCGGPVSVEIWPLERIE